MPRLQVRALYAIPTEALPAFEPLLDAGAVRIVQDAVAAVTVAGQPPPSIWAAACIRSNKSWA
jgi:hypothetical protein